MQEIILYATANEVLARVRDRANAKAATPPTLARGCGFRLKIRLFANAYDDTPYPIANLANITSWAFVMDSDWDSATPFKIVADAGEIAVGEVQDQYEGEVVTYTEAVVPVSETNTEELAAWLGSDEGKDGLNAELIGYDGTGEEAFVLQIKGFSVRNRLGSVGDPTPIPSAYLTADQVRALIASGAVLQFSPDGATWKDSQEEGDIYLRFRSASDASAAWSQAIALPRGANGADGESAFLYVRYASDAEGTGFSATPSPSLPFIGILATDTALDPVEAPAFSGLWVRYLGEGTPGKDGASAYIYVAYASDNMGSNFSLSPTSGLKYRAELHTNIPLESPNAADFSGVTWVKYLGDDGAGAGDMLKAVYDLDDDGVVDSAAKLATARKIGSANFDGTGNISLSDMGAQPALPTNGVEGQFLQKTAAGVTWATPPSTSWGQITGDIQNQTDLANALDGKISSPSGGTAGQVLTKTATGAEWADAPSGGTSGEGGTDAGAVRYVKSYDDYLKVCDLAREQDIHHSALFLAASDISGDFLEIRKSMNGEVVDDTLRKGHAYLRVDLSGGSSLETRTVSTSTYVVEKVRFVPRNGGTAQTINLLSGREDAHYLFPDSFEKASASQYGFTFKGREPAADAALNGGWPTAEVDISQRIAAYKEELDREGTYIGPTPWYLADAGVSNVQTAFKKMAEGYWMMGYVSYDPSTGKTSESFLSSDPYDLVFLYKDSTGSYVETPTPNATETTTENNGLYGTGGVATIDITPDPHRLDIQALEGTALAVSPGKAYSWTLSGNGTLSLGDGWEAGSLSDSVVLLSPGSYSVSCSGNVTMVDALQAGKMNLCVVRWLGDRARLYVVDSESPGTITAQPVTASGTVGTSMSVNLADYVTVSTGANSSYAMASGSTLPSGLSLSSEGVLSGTPESESSDSLTVDVTAAGCTPTTLALTMNITAASTSP